VFIILFLGGFVKRKNEREASNGEKEAALIAHSNLQNVHKNAQSLLYFDDILVMIWQVKHRTRRNYYEKGL
jgi:hypothetical protein